MRSHSFSCCLLQTSNSDRTLICIFKIKCIQHLISSGLSQWRLGNILCICTSSLQHTTTVLLSTRSVRRFWQCILYETILLNQTNRAFEAMNMNQPILQPSNCGNSELNVWSSLKTLIDLAGVTNIMNRNMTTTICRKLSYKILMSSTDFMLS